VPAERGLWLVRQIEHAARVERFVAPVLEERPARRAPAGFGHHVHLRAAVASVLGVVGVLGEGELLDRIEARRDDEPVQEQIVVVDPVEQEVVRGLPRARHVDARVCLRGQS
jgi:hypothetical protein